MTAPARRRNGKSASCEPCRRGKVRCEHERPVCGRCKHRGLRSKCFYHPAPLTKPRGIGKVTFHSGTTSASLTHCESPETQSFTDATNSDIQYALRSGSESDVRRLQFQDSESSLKRQVDEIIEVLKNFCYLDEIQSLIQNYASTAVVPLVPGPILLYATSTLFETSRKYSLRQSNSNNERFEILATEVLTRTSSNVTIHPELGHEAFVDLFTGDNLRLEALGLIYTLAARARVFRLPRGAERNDKILYSLFKAGQTCLNLTRELAPSMNDFLLWLSFEVIRLYTNTQGFSHPNVWRSLGDTISDVYIMEIHREAKVTLNTPFWLAECRRKTWSVIFHWDKLVATIFQRPPRLFKRYSDCVMPLNLADHELLGNPAIVEEARSRLTREGWNTEGLYCSTTWCRMRFMASVLEEEILKYDIQKPTGGTTDELERLADRCQAFWASLPESLRYIPDMWHTRMAPSACMMLAIIYMFYLRCELQIYRILMREDSAYTGKTLEIANQLISTVNHLGRVRDRNVFLQHDNSYVMLCYGLPATAILVESISSNSIQSLPQDISRSKLIRDLAVFVSHLQSICAPGEANHTACAQAAQMISHALDEILDPRTMIENSSAPTIINEVTSGAQIPNPSQLRTSPAATDGIALELENTAVYGADAFDLDTWLKNIDWGGIGSEYPF